MNQFDSDIRTIARSMPMTRDVLLNARWLNKCMDAFLNDRQMCDGRTKEGRLCLNIGTKKVVNNAYCYLHRA